MQNTFPYLDILIFGVIAIFLIFRLKNILGTKTGFEETNTNKKNQDKQFTNVVSLETKKSDLENIEINKILEADPKFDASNFLTGSRTFFKMVLNSFVNGNLDDVKDFIKPSVFKSFKSAIEERNKENETLAIDLKSIQENKIIKATITKSSIKINVQYKSLQIRVLMDKNEKIIDGDNNKEMLVKDEWVYERKIKDQSTNWMLIETKSY